MTPACKPAAKSTDFDELTAAQSAAYLGCSRATFYRAVACGWIAKSTRTFAGPRWLRYQLDEAKREHAQKGKRRKKAKPRK